MHTTRPVLLALVLSVFAVPLAAQGQVIKLNGDVFDGQGGPFKGKAERLGGLLDLLLAAAIAR